VVDVLKVDFLEVAQMGRPAIIYVCHFVDVKPKNDKIAKTPNIVDVSFYFVNV
jgi:hypothetical protein